MPFLLPLSILLGSLLPILALSSDGTSKQSLDTFQQPSASDAIASPSRPLTWGDLQIIHTTDTHTWLPGHLHSDQPEPNYSGDWGDFYSFVVGMKDEARIRGVDLLVVDSGDLHDGNGFGDMDPGVKGSTSSEFFKKIPYDILSIGNHELYKYDIASNFYENFAPYWNGSYLTSNVNITIPIRVTPDDRMVRHAQVPFSAPSEKYTNVSIPLGARYRKWTTERGRQITALGVLFNFKNNAPGTTVQPASELVKESWFKEAISERPDLFLIVGHMPARDPGFNSVFHAIRELHPDVPILNFGGHQHIRDCIQLDGRSMTLASGRYMETIGWMSVQGLNATGNRPLQFERRYLDQNRKTYGYHLNNATFDTKEGVEISRQILKVTKSFDLGQKFGTAPQSYYVDRAPPGSPSLLSSLFSSLLLPSIIRPAKGHSRRPYLTILNSGSLRFDIYQGPFTLNDQFLTYPFDNKFVAVEKVPKEVADKVLDRLNQVGEFVGSGSGVRNVHRHSHGGCGEDAEVEEVYREWIRAQYQRYQSRASSADDFLTYGYVTHDACGTQDGDGDDTPHRPVPIFPQPQFVATELLKPDGLSDTEAEAAEVVDVVFVDFIAPLVVNALNYLSGGPRYTVQDVYVFTNVKANEALRQYAIKHWN